MFSLSLKKHSFFGDSNPTSTQIGNIGSMSYKPGSNINESLNYCK